MSRQLTTNVLYRSGEIGDIDIEERTVKIAFSSEYPVPRWDGVEILDHSPKSVRLGRLKAGGAVLVDHDPTDHVGVVKDVKIDADRRGRAVIRFGRSGRATDIFNDIVDGIRSSISVGYRVYKAIAETIEGDTPAYRVTDWEPHELSIVAIPADPTAQVGRSDTEDNIFIIEGDEMEEAKEKVTPAQQRAEVVDVEKAVKDAVKLEQDRINEILQLGKRASIQQLAEKAIEEGKTIDQFRQIALNAVIKEKGQVVEEKKININDSSAEIGLTEKEKRSYSFVKMINYLSNPNDQRARENAKFEIECSRAHADLLGVTPKGIMIPLDVLKRDLTVGTPTAGGNLVGTNLMAGSFIDLLRNKMAVAGMGATVLNGLVGNIAIPRQSGGASSYWVAESGAPTESQATFDQVSMSPKTIGAFSDMSRKLLIQGTPDVEMLVQRDLAMALALGIDLASIAGTGTSNQPTGILSTSGIGDVAGGTNGLAPDWSHIVDLETAVAIDNADIGSLGYLTNAKVRGKLKQTYTNATYGDMPVWAGSEMNGYRSVVSNQVPSNLDKGTSTGVCSAIIFGNWSDLIIGMWSGLDVTVDPYTASTSGTVRVVALQDVDIAVRHPESFSAMQDALTA